MRRTFESTQYTSEQFQKLMSDHGVVCSMSRSGNDWDNAAMESFFASLKTERTSRKMYRTRDQAKADVFVYIDCFYNPKRRHSTIGSKSRSVEIGCFLKLLITEKSSEIKHI